MNRYAWLQPNKSGSDLISASYFESFGSVFWCIFCTLDILVSPPQCYDLSARIEISWPNYLTTSMLLLLLFRNNDFKPLDIKKKKKTLSLFVFIRHEMSNLHAGHLQKSYSDYTRVCLCFANLWICRSEFIINVWFEISLIMSYCYIIFSAKWIKIRQSHMSCWTHQGNHTHTQEEESVFNSQGFNHC